MIRKLFQLGEWADAAEKFLDCLALLGKKESCSQFLDPDPDPGRQKITHTIVKREEISSCDKCWMFSIEG